MNKFLKSKFLMSTLKIYFYYSFHKQNGKSKKANEFINHYYIKFPYYFICKYLNKCLEAANQSAKFVEVIKGI